MFEQAWRLFRTDITLDIGSARTRISTQDQGLLFDEPTLVVTKTLSKGKPKSSAQIVAMGNSAKQYIGRTAPNMTIHHPVVQGVCVNPSLLETFLKAAIQQTCGSTFLRPKILMVMPHGLTSQERKTFIDILYRLGNRESVFVDTLLCAGLGCRLPINEPIGSLLLHIGHGCSQVGVITLSGLATSTRSTIAGESINSAIVEWVRDQHNLEIGYPAAVDLKASIGNADSDGEIRSYPCTVKDINTGQFKQVEFDSNDIALGIQKPLRKLITVVRETVATLSPEMCADIIQNGLMITGGSAQLTGIDDFFSSELRLPVFIADQPHLSAIKGAGELLNNADLLDWLGEEHG